MGKYLNFCVSFFALLWYKLFNWKGLKVCGLPVSIRYRNLRVYKDAFLSLGKRINMYGNSELVSLNGGILKVGDAVYFNRNCNVVCRNNIEIGSLCRFGPNVCIYDHDHEYSSNGVTDIFKLGTVVIGRGCWFGANVVILRDSYIGEGSVIGAGVVFKGICPPHSLVYRDKKDLVIKQINNEI